MTEARLLVTGNRDWDDRERIRDVLVDFASEHCLDSDQITLIHGAAPGADTIASQEAKALGWHVIACPADWRRHGMAAGPIRNQAMLDDHAPTHGIAFGTLRRGQRWTGTGDMVCRLIDAEVPVKCIPRRKNG